MSDEVDRAQRAIDRIDESMPGHAVPTLLAGRAVALALLAVASEVAALRGELREGRRAR